MDAATQINPQHTRAINAFWDALEPEPLLTVSAWSDEHRYLSNKASSEPGKWRTDRTPYLREIMDCLSASSPVEEVVFKAGAQLGKALPLDTPIPTPNGWTTMGDIQIGDEIFGRDGKICRVSFKTPVMYDHQCYEITFSDGQKIVADAEHRWYVEESRKGKPAGNKVINTAEIFERYKDGTRNRFAIPVAGALDLPPAELLVDPYVLGVWLGDGNSNCAQVTCHIDDMEIANYIAEAGHAVLKRQIDKRAPDTWNMIIDPIKKDRRFCDRGHDMKLNGKRLGRCRICCNQRSNAAQRGTPIDPVKPKPLTLTEKLAKIEVLNNKHIPMQYLRASIYQRTELLKGLMDTDGTVGVTGSVEFCTASDRLKDDFMELCWSLGFKPSCRMASHAKAWRITFTAYRENSVFKLKRKAERLLPSGSGRASETNRRRIVNVQAVSSVPVRCIQVDSEDHLFLAGRFMVPTHNTESGNNWIGYCVDHAPGPMMLVQPTVDIAKRLSKQRLAPLFEETPRLRTKIRSSRDRDSGNTVLMKEFPGGVMIITGANSAAGLRSMPARYLFLDEIDAYPLDVEGEGDPCDLAIARSRTFARRKIYKSSTPTLDGLSRIDAAYNDSDQREYHVPCPHCYELQVLKWSNVIYRPKHAPTEAVYACQHCGCEIEEYHKTWMMDEENGAKWIAKRPGWRGGLCAGFAINSLYSPVGWFSWLDAARMWVKANQKKDQNALKTFVNTVLGETWKEVGDAPDWKRLYDRRENYPINTIPTELVLFLTAAVDVQKDRLEVEIKGWGRGRKSWSIDHRILLGQYTDKSAAGPWAQVDQILNEQWRHPSGHMLSVSVMTVDASAYTMEVRDWCRKYPMTRVLAIKGSDTMQSLIGKPRPVDVELNGNVIKRGLQEWTVGVNKGKEEIYGWLNLDKPIETEWRDYPDGYMFIPEYPDEYFKQLTAEHIVTKVVKGYRRTEWEKTRDRNEVLDLATYNRIAAAAYGIDRLNDEEWQILEDNLSNTVPQSTNNEPVRRKRSDYWG